MAEVDFERRLERLFAEAPEFPDAQVFADRVGRRIQRGWDARRWLIGAAGLIGGVVGASQLMMSNLFERVETAESSARVLTDSLAQAAPGADVLAALSTGDAGVWIATGLAIVTMGFVLRRVIEEI